VPVALNVKKSQRSRVVLVQQGEKGVLETIASWTDSIDEGKILEWMEQGLVFPDDDDGARALLDAEEKRIEIQKSKQKFVGASKFAANLFLETPTSSNNLFVKSSRPSAVARVKKSLSEAEMEDYLSRGDVFNNATKLMVDEQLLGRVNSIATRMQNDFPINSPEWKRWTDRTSVYNATSLSQVMATYFQEYSIGDVGGPNANYVPKRGYPGTLAPGEKFTDNYPIEELPNKILHAWPAMQQIQFHVRYPPNHPLLPPPLLWIGLNAMYTDSFSASQMSEPADEIVGGAAMEPKDAMRIAQFAKLGSSYDPAEQIEHGGMIFSGGHQIPFYNPDHGPTVSDQMAEPPVPKHLLPITERWLDPLHGLDVPVLKSATDETDLEDELMEQEIRKYTMEKLLSNLPNVESEEPEPMTPWDQNKRRVEDELTEVLILRNDALNSTVEWHDDEPEKAPIDIETLAMRMSEPCVERDQARIITESIFDKPMGRRQLVGYVIDSFRDMQKEILKAERDISSRRKGGKRRSRKKSSSNEDDSDDIEEEMPIIPE